MKSKHSRRGRRDGVWWAGLVVAAAAAAATAHGLYAVAEASDVPWPVAVLYPVMTDGLALLEYSATNRLTDGSRRYAWTVVVVAAGLSGVAQALYLAGGGLDDSPAAVRFGIGAAPAMAAAAVAHLLHLIRTAVNEIGPSDRPEPTEAVQPDEAVQAHAVQPGPIEPAAEPASAAVTPARATAALPSAGGSAAERATRAAMRHREQHGSLPTTSTLVRLTNVSRGTAGTVLKGLRTQSGPDDSTTTPDEHRTDDPTKIQSDHTPMHHDPEEDQLQDRANGARAGR